MLKFIIVRTTGAFPGEKRFRSKHGKAMRAGHKMMGQYWIDGGVRERHFQASARHRYGYTPRSTNYQKAKKRKYGHTLYLVYSGQSQRQTEYSRVTPSSRRARMSIPAGSLNFTKGAINMREELLRLSSQDEKEMSNAFGMSYDVELRRQRGGATQVVRGAA